MYRIFFILLSHILLVFLVSCSGGANYNGVKGAKPKAEPLSKYGNPSSYKALGKKYKVMSTSRGYREKGHASWYGKDFHGKRTSSGTPYNMHTYSAAHKTLPIPTYVLVTNLENKRKLVVRIDDRGPFVSGRIIDLSYKAAHELGIANKGTAKVMVEALPPYQSMKNARGTAIVPPSVIPEPSSPTPIANLQLESPIGAPSLSYKTSYALQLGAFSNQYNASDFAESIAFQAKQSPKIHFDGRLYRVLTGSYSTRSLAETASSSLKQSGLTNTIYLIQ